MEEIDFEEMRNQIAILKTKLDKQEVINEQMMRQLITTKTDPIKRKMLTSVVSGFLVITIVVPVVFYKVIGVSWTFIFATDIMMIYFMTREYLFYHKISDNTLMNAPLLEVVKKMKNFKKGYQRYMLSNLMLILIWAFWLVLDSSKNYDESARYAFMAGLAAGGVIGLIIGLIMYFRIQRAASDIIRQIEE